MKLNNNISIKKISLLIFILLFKINFNVFAWKSTTLQDMYGDPLKYVYTDDLKCFITENYTLGIKLDENETVKIHQKYAPNGEIYDFVTISIKIDKINLQIYEAFFNNKMILIQMNQNQMEKLKKGEILKFVVEKADGTTLIKRINLTGLSSQLK